MSQKLKFSLIVWVAAIGFQGFALERYEKMPNWAEGTLTAIHPDGTFSIRGMESPYAHQYFSYMRDYNSVPEPERTDLLPRLHERYKAGLNYKWDEENLHDFALYAVYPEDVKVFNEAARYGNSVDSWTFADNSRIDHYKDLEAGDRVIVGFDDHNAVNAIYRANPVRATEGKPAPTVTIKDGVFGTTVTRPANPYIDPRTGLHVMNLGSNETNNKGSKSGSDSGHIMNSGSNSTNNAPLNPASPYTAPR